MPGAHLCHSCREHRGRTATASHGSITAAMHQWCRMLPGEQGNLCPCEVLPPSPGSSSRAGWALHSPVPHTSCNGDMCSCGMMEVVFVPASGTAGERKVKSSCLLPLEPFSALPSSPAPLSCSPLVPSLAVPGAGGCAFPAPHPPLPPAHSPYTVLTWECDLAL